MMNRNNLLNRLHTNAGMIWLVVGGSIFVSLFFLGECTADKVRVIEWPVTVEHLELKIKALESVEIKLENLMTEIERKKAETKTELEAMLEE